jgi:spermidine synthase
MSRQPTMRRRMSHRHAALALALLLGVALVLHALSTRERVLFDAESEFGRVRVAEQRTGLRTLYTGEARARQSVAYPSRPEHLELPYTQVAMVGLGLVPPDGRLLFIGLGGGSMPRFAHRALPNAQIEAVEIDPVIVNVARRYFGFPEDERMSVHTADGRAYIEQAAPGSYDAIFLDAFSDDEIPLLLATEEFLHAVRRALKPGGVVVSNLWTRNRDYESMLATYAAVFAEVTLIRVPRRSQRILVASTDRPLSGSVLHGAAVTLAARTRAGFDLPGLVREGVESPRRVTAPVLRDPPP